MKRAAVICLTLIVLFFLIPSAFAEEYIAILVGVNSGNVVEVYAANQVGSHDPNNPGVIILRCKLATPHRDANGIPLPPPSTTIDEKCIKTKFATSSPGCRYVLHPAGYWVKVCN